MDMHAVADRRRAGRLMIIVVALLLVSACTVPPFGPFDPRGRDLPDQPTRSTPLPADQIVLEVIDDPGGLAPQALYAVTSPSLVIFGDGRILLLDQQATGPGLHRSYQLARVDPELVAGLAERARGAGLTERLDLGSPEVLDAGVTFVRVHGTGDPVTQRAYAFYPDLDRQLGQSYRDRRARLRSLIQAGFDLAADAARSPYVPDRIFVYEQKVRADTPATLPWPGPAPDTFLTGRRSFRGFRCGELRGHQAATVHRLAAENPTQHWTVQGRPRLLLLNTLPASRPACS